MLTRRAFLSALTAPAFARLQAGGGGRRLLAQIPFAENHAPLDRVLGTGLDARLFTDLTAASAAAPIDNGRFFVRTAAPAALRDIDNWTISLGGRVRQPVAVGIDELRKTSTRTGRHAIECAGNSVTAAYGLMSQADWEGVPIQRLLDRVTPLSPRHRVLVSGLDDGESPGGTSVPGASWIFTRDELARAFLATRMNGEPLPRNHGAPVRLVIPNWYGCACVKWVNQIDIVDDDAPATSQMKEYAARTHQSGVPPLARDYEPAVVDTAAMPVRVSKWQLAGGRVGYTVEGIMWGGTKPTNALEIRFRSGGPWTRVDRCPLPASTSEWTAWSHDWRPEGAGRYDIVLRIADRSIRTRRLDLFFYVRSVVIDEA